MRENEFERKVQEQMEELRIRPSDETWERVEKELREKKKRRAAILFFIMAGLLLLGYSGYTFLNKSSDQSVAYTPVTTPNTTTNKNSAVAEQPVTTPKTNQTDENKTATPSLNAEAVKENPVALTQTPGDKNREPLVIVKPGRLENAANVKGKAADPMQKQNAINSQKKKAIISQAENNPVNSISAETAIVSNSINQTQKKPVLQNDNKKDNIISNSIAFNTITNKDQSAAADSVTAIDSTVAKTEISKTDLPQTEEPKPAIAKNENKSRLKFGVEVSGGFVSSQNKVFGFNVGSQYKLENRAQSGYSGNPATPSNAPGITPPSDVKAGKSFRIGLIAEKAISKSSTLSAGLRYSYADESLKVGSIRDTVIRSNSYSFSQNFFAYSGVRGAYASSSLSTSAAAPRSPIEYTNKYHFLELPLLYQTQLNKGKRVGILWNAGIAPGFLIGTNALVYDTAARGVYYENDKAFKKFHFNMQTGFALQFGNNQKIQWSLGPTVSMDMSRLMKEDVFTEKRYFLYTGLTGRVFFNSRKK